MQGLKSEFNTLAPACVACVEKGQSLAEKCESGEPKTALEGEVSDLQTKWEKLGKLFGEVMSKLTDALVQVSPSFHSMFCTRTINFSTCNY